MFVTWVEFCMETLWPAKWADYQSALYDYNGTIYRDEVCDWRGAEIWCAAPGKRLRPVEVVVVDGVRLRVIDRERGGDELGRGSPSCGS